jgi:hypothetical protein
MISVYLTRIPLTRGNDAAIANKSIRRRKRANVVCQKTMMMIGPIESSLVGWHIECWNNEDWQGQDDDDWTWLSQASLLDMLSFKLKIGKAQLAALLAEEEHSSSKDEKDNNKGERRRMSWQLRHHAKAQSAPSNSLKIGANFDEAKILLGKRPCKVADYRKLKIALFGDSTAKEMVQIDDAEHFLVKKKQ